ncbi:MAG: GNAT family N-acetyltransferase [Bacteroidetes bacterium GWE2_41_25]|nr:MAG: GNAT family N-acetyltransferase [Bacteroidetes bacterium GWA2_40_15]OFX91118.1 MAG: GNAT family N-acetyltransferase [Bacteroidetes bacterium GWC2_40_22]OFX97012.1 MAG: GNAT family N-acetyltransferase [Bacteroidetes bacterium GWE2_41_25]OFY60311.1 MAG: GNAT family N-acetyltransferase [Bacteroidetes bacterium GWF2_41_9]HAM09177.1 GNAT family N-acetyltransferase [Bacteroidales bacterium]
MITIRNANPDDAEVIIDFQQKMAWETEQMTLVTEMVTDGVKAVFDNSSRGKYWVAEQDNLLIASLLITYEWSDWRNAEVWWLQSVYVLPGYRRQGVFRMMYSHIRKLAEKQDVAGLRLYVETKNIQAQKTYEALGMSSEHYAFYEWMRK